MHECACIPYVHTLYTTCLHPCIRTRARCITCSRWALEVTSEALCELGGQASKPVHARGGARECINVGEWGMGDVTVSAHTLRRTQACSLLHLLAAVAKTPFETVGELVSKWARYYMQGEEHASACCGKRWGSGNASVRIYPSIRKPAHCSRARACPHFASEALSKLVSQRAS
jgi:hypothetical protein